MMERQNRFASVLLGTVFGLGVVMSPSKVYATEQEYQGVRLTTICGVLGSEWFYTAETNTQEVDALAVIGYDPESRELALITLGLITPGIRYGRMMTPLEFVRARGLGETMSIDDFEGSYHFGKVVDHYELPPTLPEAISNCIY